ncbi:MAG: hydroxymethylglutaryl-CoA reductase, partial [Bacteroidales bacterium]|nr:hydroxymethylglutaryl-CoA reductase [Bacteroidales bacterium]
MNRSNFIKGFSKLSREEKIEIIASQLPDPLSFVRELKDLEHPDKTIQEKLNNFSENTLSNFPLPFGIAPNFLINGETYAVPMVIEESSVVAAASSAARFWYEKGGFQAEVREMTKIGQIHFKWNSVPEILVSSFPELRERIISGTRHLTENMERRGGGIIDLELVDMTESLKNGYQIRFRFNTADSMGANFINSVLEESAAIIKQFFQKDDNDIHSPVEILMSILSNYTPECLVHVRLKCPTKELDTIHPGYTGEQFAQRFVDAINIAREDVYRAVTHNKGIYNGVDAVIMATGNDYRAAEAAGHAFAARNGKYSSLSSADVAEGEFIHELTLPLALGTVGGLTALHPLARWAFEILGKPGSRKLMMIAGATGLASNFAAIRSLVTTGIQKGHMKMHLENILAFFNASVEEKQKVKEEFGEKIISHS